MVINVDRKWKKETYTVGRLYINNEYYCNTLEDRVRRLPQEKKVPGETAIPAGKYNVVYTLSPKFKRRLPRLENVPFFDGILIHPGNSAGDTQGCILVGKNTEVGRLTDSRATSDGLNKMIDAAIKRGERVSIIIDNAD
jgi:hypothetical protein